MAPVYEGPLRGQPLPVELHNTLYASGGAARDGIADAAGLRAWLSAGAGDLPGAAGAVDAGRIAEFHALRGAARAALRARADDRAVPAAARRALNAAAAVAPRSPQLLPDGRAAVREHCADPTTIVLAALAAATIELIGGPEAPPLRACGAPGCVLLFVADRPRRAWCSDACGNRARQARHYARQRRL